MWANPQFPADLVTFTEEILKGKFHFLCSTIYSRREVTLTSISFYAKTVTFTIALKKVLTLLSTASSELRLEEASFGISNSKLRSVQLNNTAARDM